MPCERPLGSVSPQGCQKVEVVGGRRENGEQFAVVSLSTLCLLVYSCHFLLQ